MNIYAVTKEISIQRLQQALVAFFSAINWAEINIRWSWSNPFWIGLDWIGLDSLFSQRESMANTLDTLKIVQEKRWVGKNEADAAQVNATRESELWMERGKSVQEIHLGSWVNVAHRKIWQVGG